MAPRHLLAAVPHHRGHQGQVGVAGRAGVDLVTPVVRLVAVHLTDQTAELGAAVLGLRPEGELCQLFPRRMIAGDVQRADPQR